MDSTIPTLIDVACVWLRRAGLAGEESAGGQAKLAEWQRAIQVCCQKQGELDILRSLLSLAGRESQDIHNRIEVDRDWMVWFQNHGQAFEASQQHREKLVAKELQARQEFKKQTWVTHTHTHRADTKRWSGGGWAHTIQQSI